MSVIVSRLIALAPWSPVSRWWPATGQPGRWRARVENVNCTEYHKLYNSGDYWAFCVFYWYSELYFLDMTATLYITHVQNHTIQQDSNDKWSICKVWLIVWSIIITLIRNWDVLLGWWRSLHEISGCRCCCSTDGAVTGDTDTLIHTDTCGHHINNYPQNTTNISTN